mgnify:FL=1
MFWLSILAVLGGVTAFISTIAYGLDTGHKNIPVTMKYMLTSVLHGWPPPDAADAWSAEFKQPDHPVWPYYTLLGAFLTSLMILIAFAAVGCTYDETERSSRTCCQSCGCSDNGNHCLFCYCNDPCPYNVYGGGGSGGSCCCGDCGGGGRGHDCDCKGSGGGGEALIVIAIVVVVVVLVSAIFVVIGYALRKWALFHDRMTDMLLRQQCELEGETVVLGMHESVRPLNEV